jgi:hypothetical protein
VLARGRSEWATREFQSPEETLTISHHSGHRFIPLPLADWNAAHADKADGEEWADDWDDEDADTDFDKRLKEELLKAQAASASATAAGGK